MAKLSDTILTLLGKTFDPIGPEKRAEMAQNQQQIDNQRLTALAHFGSVYDTGNTPMNVPGMGQMPLNPRPQSYLPITQDASGNSTYGTVFNAPHGTKPIIGKPSPSANNANRPRQTPYTDESGTPLLLGSDGALTPATLPQGGKAVPFKGDESAVGDANLIAQQYSNVDKLFDAYKSKSGIGARAQSTGLGGLIDPEAKQLEDSLKLTAFTFGGKNLTGQEKEVVFGALFPSWKDNEGSRELKRNLLKDFFSGKVDLLQAANLLGSAGGTLRNMLQTKGGTGRSNIPNRPNQPALGSSGTSGTQTLGQTIRVRNKQTGQTGSIPSANFDPGKYDQL